MFFTIDDTIRLNKQLNKRPREFVSEELRGWRWNEPPLLHNHSTQLMMIDAAGGLCPTSRDVYVRYTARIKEAENPHLQRGQLIHLTYEAAIRTVKKLIYNEKANRGIELIDLMKEEGEKELHRIHNMKKWLIDPYVMEKIFWSLWDQASTTYSGALDRIKTRSKYLSIESIVNAVVPINVEVMIDGSLIGLSKSLRLDAMLFPTIPIEIKTRTPERIFEVSLAGYALAIESQFEAPVDFGILIHVNIDDNGNTVIYEKIIPISDELRLEFIHERDKKAEIIEKNLDPGLPSKCNIWCPYLHYCGGHTEENTTNRRMGIKIETTKRTPDTTRENQGRQ